MKNQYFKLVFRDDQALLHIYPAEDRGKKLDISEVKAYLEERNYSGYDLKELNAALNVEEGESEVYVGVYDGAMAREKMKISISLDKMRAVCRFYPPSDGGVLMDAKEITGDMVARNIRYGIDQDAIFRFLEKREYCTDFVFAKGTDPIHGKDAKIEYYFNTNLNLQPKRNEDGSVDYRDLNTISHINKGDLLARLIPEDPGTSGQNIFGEEIRPRTVKQRKLEFGNKISINEDRTEIYSDVTGHASLVNDKVFVSDVFEVAADVDNSVGNIVYAGSVLVKGNVKSGFSIEADGDVVVEGVVENATIISGGQIVVKRGIQGMHKGTFKAASNVISRYIENATVEAGGYVESELILNSNVSCSGTIRVFGKKGLVNGGVLRAGNFIEALNLGTEMGTPTMLEVGVEPKKKERYIELQKYLADEEQKLDDAKVIIDNYGAIIKKGEHLPADKLLYVQKMVLAYKEKKQSLEPVREEMSQIHVEMMQAAHSYIQVSRSVYPGVVISISDKEFHVKEVMNNVKFKKQDGEIQKVPL